MLRKFAVALIASSLIAAPAFAAQSSGSNGAAPATPAAQTQQPANPTKTVKHVRRHSHKHVARVKTGTMHQARHGKLVMAHQASVAKPAKGS
jgi:uncharacterized protein YdeI (BOF family)